MDKKILIIAQNFYPEIGSAGNRIKNIYKLLKENGENVKIVTTEPTYPNRQLYQDDHFWDDQAIDEDVENVNRIKIVNRKYSNSIFNRLLYYLEMAFKMLLFILRDKSKYDYVFVTSPPIFVGFVGLIAKYRYRTKLVLDVRDLWPESLKGVGVFNYPFIIAIFGQLEKLLYVKADQIIVNSEGFNNHIVNKGNIPLGKISYLPNGAKNEEIFAQGILQEQFSVIYAGNIGLAQDDQLLIELAIELKKHQINLSVIGYGVNKERLLEHAKKNDLSNLTFIKPVSRKECLKLMSQHHVGIVTLTDKDVFTTVLPGKVIDYMTCGTPIVAAVSGNSKEIIQKAKVGFVSEDRNVDAMLKSILYLKQNPKARQTMSQNGKRYVKDNFSWEQNIEVLLQVFGCKVNEKKLGKVEAL